MSKTFGQFEPISDSQSTQANKPVGLPPIAGTPMPNPGMNNKTMGSVFPSKDNPSPKQFQNRKDAAKRMSQMPKQSPLGPVTGMPRPQQPATAIQPQQQGSPNMDAGAGDRWMGELWQGLTMDNQPQGGFAMGGQVGSSNPAMDLYNQVTMELESGGVNGYAQGGMVDKSREIASMGRNGDTMLMHINPQELGGLQSLLGPITVNPDTGNPEAFAWFAALPLVAQLGVGALAGAGAGAGIGAAAGGKDGALKGLAIGGMLGTLGAGGLGAAGAGAGAAAGGGGGVPLLSAAGATPAVQAAQTTASLMGGSSALAPGAGVLAPGFGGGVTAAEAAAMGAAPTVAGTELAGMSGAGLEAASSGLSKAGLARAGASGLSSLMSQSEDQQRSTPRMPTPASPKGMPMRNSDPVSPYGIMKRRMQGGVSSLPGSGRIA
jgi:hypothetical protein